MTLYLNFNLKEASRNHDHDILWFQNMRREPRSEHPSHIITIPSHLCEFNSPETVTELRFRIPLNRNDDSTSSF